jgi:outer membrane protein assembly factor BamA
MTEEVFTQSISGGARAGAMWALGGRPTLFSDRFQLGGPTSVRMFRANSMGPRDGGKHPFVVMQDTAYFNVVDSRFIGRRHLLFGGIKSHIRHSTQAPLAGEDPYVRKRRTA